MSPRPKNIRKIRGVLAPKSMIPKEGCIQGAVTLYLEEYESVCLCDYEGMTQAQAALQMQVSRPTLTRIYAAARKKIARALIEHMELIVDGGRVYTESQWFVCGNCHLIFNNIEPYINAELICPCCGHKVRGLDDKEIVFNKYKDMTKIALPTRQGMIDDHFGHCEFYTIVTVDENKNVVLTETMPSPQGCGCKSNIAFKLQEDGVSLMLAGNMGQGALNKLQSCGIKVIRGCQGAVLEVVKAYLNGEIQDSGIACHHHDESHECGHHHDAAHECGNHK